MANRLDRWDKSEFIDIPFGTTGGTFTDVDNRVVKYIGKVQKRFRKVHGKDYEPWNTQSGILKACKELIYNIKEGVPVFHAISYYYNVRRGELELGHNLDILISGDTPEEINNDILNTLAVAFTYEVPVYPNTEELADELANVYRVLMIDGFTAPDEKGGRIRLKLTKSPGSKIESIEYLNEITLSEPRYPAELALIRNAVKVELGKLSNAKKLLTNLEFAIHELEKQLYTKKRNESRLQNCLTENPVLLGLEYQKVKPKHKLGSEYEMDYALERYSGLYDLLELESSSLPLFNKKGDPSHHLVHAEQQVMDWHRWIERNNPYARETLPGIINPFAFIVIGRSDSFDNNSQEKLKHRNVLFHGNIEILTYDDVLKKAKTMFRIITGTLNSQKKA